MTTRIRFSLLFTALLATASLSAQQTDSLLSKAYDRDQAIRIELARLGKAANTGGYTDSLIDSLVMLSEEMERIDSRNLRLVDSILRDGIPVGLAEKSYDAIWIIIDHAPLDVQKKRLPMLKRAAKEGFISPNRMAALSDRIAMREGRRQRFGTQSYQTVVDGKPTLYIWPVRNARRLNARRQQINTCTIEEYVALLGESSGSEVVYDPKMTVKQLKRIIEKQEAVTY